MIQLQKKHIEAGALSLADAFDHDPLWNKLFEGDSPAERAKHFKAFFEFPIRHCLHYGWVEASSENLEGIACWVPGHRADQTFWSVLRCGLLGAALRLGSVSKYIPEIFDPVAEHRKEAMSGRDYAYLFAIGVRQDAQGRGIGRSLLTSGLDHYDKLRQPIYLETETAENVKLYEHFGFRVLKEVTVARLNLPLWEMVREPA